MHRRSKKYEVSEEEKEKFIEEIKETLKYHQTCTIVNKYPYDMLRNEQVKTSHMIMFFYKFNHEVLEQIENYNSVGYTVQMNSQENQSIPEIKHIHFIKQI